MFTRAKEQANASYSFIIKFQNAITHSYEMVRCNTSRTKGFHRLDSGKLGFLVPVLQRKFDSPFFSEQWNQIAARINTKCRGKRRTLIHRLEKTCFENTKMAQLVYHFTLKIMGQLIEQS